MNISSQKGSTILEVLIAMFILALVIVGLNAGVVQLITSNRNTKELNTATAVGYELFEKFRRDDYNTMLAIGTNVDIVRNRYVRDWRMTSDATKTKIDLFVRWPATTQKHYITLSTIIARP